MSPAAKRFAAATDVPAGKTKQELDELLARHGATQRGTFEEAGRGLCVFTMAGRQIRLQIKLPKVDELEPTPLPRGWWGWSLERRTKWKAERNEQAARSAWRRLLLVTRAKLELVHDGTSVEREFLADVLLPDGQTVHEALAAKLERSYQDGSMPPLLLGSGGG